MRLEIQARIYTGLFTFNLNRLEEQLKNICQPRSWEQHYVGPESKMKRCLVGMSFELLRQRKKEKERGREGEESVCARPLPPETTHSLHFLAFPVSAWVCAAVASQATLYSL